MKQLLLAICIMFCLALVGCGPEEKQRYRVEVVEIVNGDDGEVGYIVSKEGYTVGGIYVMETENVYELGDIVYVVVLDEYTAMPFLEWNEDR